GRGQRAEGRGIGINVTSVKEDARQAVVQKIQALGVVAVIRMKDAGKLREVVDAIAAGGVRAIEVTMTVPDAISLIARLAPSLPADILLGAGTGHDAATARAVIDAGAQYVVSPVFRREVIAACHERGVAAAPGCFTPTEILDAHDAGADIVKVFPATALGPQFIKDVRAPLPQVRLMPTGGVTLDNAGEWIRAGAVAVGVGSALVDTRAIEDGRPDLPSAYAGDRRRPPRRAHGERAAHRGQRRVGAVTAIMPQRVVTFGEIMLRLSPPGFERFFQSPVLGATFGGGEANVAVSLAQFGLDSHYVTRLPTHAIGDAAVRALRAEGVDTRHVIRGGRRGGVEFPA